MNFTEVYLQGSAYERGFTHGRTCAKEVCASIAIYREMFLAEQGIAMKQAACIGRSFLTAVREYNPDYVQEMQGIADGAGVSFDEILALNARSEILSGTMPADNALNECTAFSVLPHASANGHVFAGQTWDFSPSQRNTVAVFHIRQENSKPDILMFTEAGLIGGKGINSAGIGLTLNAVWRKGKSEGIPLHIRMRSILDSLTLDEAYTRAVQGNIPCGATLIVTHRDGLSLCLELSPDGVDVILPEKDWIAHTNHYIGPRLSMLSGHASNGSTYIRLLRMRHLLSSGNLTIQKLEQILCDHAGYPSSICMHRDANKPETKQMVTNYGLIMDLSEGCAYFVPGNPCENEFVKLPVYSS